MAKYQVNLGVTANVSQAQQAINSLQNSLQSIANTPIHVSGGNLEQAVQSAKLLSEHLTKATNVNTGKLDFSALQHNLSLTNTNIVTLSNNLLAMGPKGQKAFSELSKAISMAELSTKKANGALHNFGITLMNTIKWQAASSMIHGVMGAMSSAVGHIEKLDKALNSIQIVSNKSTIEMASFAKSAQEASRALSSTTAEYADAALIYFQQGLGEKEIAERTAATLKMAKVTGDAVSTVSDQLTAIWNNFDDGSKSLEHYVDVITALGAATASSTDEIADGLQKFAAIAETVGLSYEYAATALATVTAETRQSAEVVGTAFKTLFARIEGLSLGETLDDGTSLNKYSQALATVGINIKDASGELKEMDTILDELGSRWQTLTKDQQVALAQTVGGVRQYNQLIALMDNWDTFKINLDVAIDSKGELNKQFEIYKTGVESSKEELKNAVESLYEELLNPDLLKGFNNVLTDIVDMIKDIVENAGGLEGVLKFGGLLLVKTFLPMLDGFLLKAKTYIFDIIGMTKANKLDTLGQLSKQQHAIAGTSAGPDNRVKNNAQNTTAMLTNTRRNVIPTVTEDMSGMEMRDAAFREDAAYGAEILDSRRALLAIEDSLTDAQKSQINQHIDELDARREALRLAREEAALKKEQADEAESDAATKTKRGLIKNADDERDKALKNAENTRNERKQTAEATRDDAMAKLDEEARQVRNSNRKKSVKEKRLADIEERRKKSQEDYDSEVSSADKDFESSKTRITEKHAKKVSEARTVDIKSKQFEGVNTSREEDTIRASAAEAGGPGATTVDNMLSSMTTAAPGDGGGIQASIDNLKTLGEQQAVYQADIQVASDLYSEIGTEIGKIGDSTESLGKATGTVSKETGAFAKAWDKVKKSQGDSSKELKNQQNLSKKVTSFASKYKEELSESLENMDGASDKLKAMVKDGKKIDLGALDSKELGALQKGIQKVSGGIKEANDAATGLGEAMVADMADATGQGADVYQGVVDSARDAQTELINAGNAKDAVDQKMNQPPANPDVFGTIANSAKQALSGVTSFAMGAQMLSTGIQTAFAEDASAMEKVTGAMMIAQGVMSTLNAIQAVGNIVTGIAAAVKLAKAAATDKEAASESKGLIPLIANTAATIANAVAKLFAAEASKGLAGVIMAVLGAALIIGTFLLVKNTVATEASTKEAQKNAEEKENQAEKTREAAAASKEELEELTKLNAEYEKALKIYQETGAGKEELVSAATEVVSAMEIENGNLLILQGNYDLLNEKIREHLRLKGIQANADAKAGVSGSAASLEMTGKSAEGGMITGQTNVGDSWANGGKGFYTIQFPLAGKETEWVKKYLEDNPSEYWGISGGNLGTWYANDSDLDLRLKELDAIYNGATAYARAQGYSLGDDGGFVERYNEMGENGEREKWDAVIQSGADADSVAVTSARNASGIDAVTSQSEYDEAYEKYMTEAFANQGLDWSKASDRESGNGKALIETANKVMYDDEVLGQYEQRRQAIVEAKESSNAARWFLDGSGNYNGKYSIENWAEENGVSTDEALDIFFTLKAYPDSSKGVWEAMDEAQKIIDGRELVAHYDLAPSMISELNEDMSYEDYGNFVDKYGDVLFGPGGALGGMTAQEFGTLGYERQVELIEQWRDGLDVVYGIEQQITGQKELQAQLSEQGIEDYAATYTAKDLGITKDQATALGPYASAGEVTGVGIDYAKLGYESAQAFADAYNEAYGEGMAEFTAAMSGYDTSIEALETEKAWREAAAERDKIKEHDLEVEEVYDYADALMEMAATKDPLDGVNDALADNEDAARDIALGIKVMNKGLAALGENFEDIEKVLNDSAESSAEYQQALKDLDEIMSDLLTIDTGVLSTEFLKSEKNLALMKQAAEGSVEAIEQLRLLAAQDIVLHTSLDDASKTAILTDLAALASQDIEIGATLNNNEFAQSLYDAAIAAGMTVDDIQNMFDSLGWEPDIKMETYTLTDKDVTNGYVEVPADLEGNVQRIPLESSMVTGATITYPVIQNGEGSKTGGFTFRGSAATTADTSNLGGGGGGSEPKKTQKTHHSEIVERYKEVNDQISDVKKSMEDAQRAAEGLWGSARIKKMREVQTEMGKELKLLRQKKAEAEAYLEQDRKWLEDIAAENGVAFTFDGNNISNYEEVMNGLYAELRQAEIDAGPTTDENEQKRIDEIQERIDAIKGAIDIYDQTKDEVKEFDTEIQEAIRSIQEAKLEELNLQLEMEIMIDESTLELLEYYLGKMNEDIWSMAEAAALMTGQSKDMFGFDTSQMETWLGQFETYQQRYNDLLWNYTHINPETGETYINQEQFVKALQELQSEVLNNLNNINELDKSMITYYGETLAAAGEELSKFTDLMDHHVEVLDHYSSLLEIIGKSKDWARMKTILQTQVDVAENAAEASKANYKMLETELLEKQAAYDALDPDDDSYEAQVIRQQWLDAKNAANEAQLQMLEDAEAWAEALKTLLETELEELGENLEKALAGDFGTLDYMMTSMERANSLQEEYLTTTNKIYETNKLMRTAQQEIDKTSNTVAKRRMAQFIEETQQMQNQNKLSQYELEIQQAKYDLLLAEIALEEAQSAKSTVRLQRDNEGNFGYVYTADQNEVANAQQQLEDAQNALYNIGLEGANKYAEQYAQTIQEMNDAVRELTEQWQNGEIASKEEYQAKMLELEEYYGEKLKQFSHLHSIAVQTDSRVANDAWTRDFANMTTQTSYWMTQVSGYADQVGQAFGRYQQGIAEVEKYAGADLDSLKEKTEKIKEENEKLVTSITDSENGLLAAMQKEIDKVSEITLKYAEWRDTIQDVIDKQEELAKQINKDIEQETDDDETNDYKPETETPETTPPEGEPNGNPGDDGTPSYKKGVLSWTGNGSARIWTDSAGKTYSATSAEGRAIQTAFNKAYGANGGYKGDYFLGWNKLNADVLHEKYGLSTGGYTGDWSGSFGKLAFLHQKELVLNKQDTENLLAAMEFLNRITSAIDLQAMNNSLGGLLSSPSLGHVGDESGILEQQVHIEASFPGISDRNELEEAFNNLINQAAQYANRK